MNSIQQSLLVQGFSAFAGAFFAFIFLRLATFFSKIYERQVKHYNSLVNLETQLNELGGVISDDLYVIPGFIRTIVGGNIYSNNLHTFPVDKSHYGNLYDIDLINLLFDFNHKIRKLNDDLETLSSEYQEIKLAFIEKNIDANQYVLNAKEVAKQLKILEAFLSGLQNDTVNLMARIRVKIRKDRPLGTKLQFLFIKTSRIHEKEIKKEILEINKELEETKTSSQKEIEKILKDNGLI